jgi:hypothetical protein
LWAAVDAGDKQGLLVGSKKVFCGCNQANGFIQQALNVFVAEGEIGTTH